MTWFISALWKQAVRAALIVVVACVVGLSVNTLWGGLSLRGNWQNHAEARAIDEGFPLINTAALLQQVDLGEVQLLDARATESFDAGHIDGALSCPVAQTEVMEELLLSMDPDFSHVVYCAGSDCEESVELAIYLRDFGFSDVKVYTGGWAAWQDELAGRQP